MHIPARYYKRIPQFYFFVGILLVITSFNMNENRLGAFLYFISGIVSVIYAVSVYQARRRRRRNAPREDLQPAPDEVAPTEENLLPPVTKRPELINDNPAVAEKQQQPDEADTQTVDKEQPQSARENNDLPQHGGSVPAPAQPELKT